MASRLELICPKCHEEVTYDRERQEWVGEWVNGDYTNHSPALGGTHKMAIEGALVYALTMGGLNRVIELLAWNR